MGSRISHMLRPLWCVFYREGGEGRGMRMEKSGNDLSNSIYPIRNFVQRSHISYWCKSVIDDPFTTSLFVYKYNRNHMLACYTCPSIANCFIPSCTLRVRGLMICFYWEKKYFCSNFQLAEYHVCQLYTVFDFYDIILNILSLGRKRIQ